MLWSGLLFLVLVTQQGMAQASSCLPSFTALQTVLPVDPADLKEHHFYLKHMRQGQLRDSRVLLQMTPKKDASGFDMQVLFDPAFEGVSLPYNLYSVMVIEDGQTIAWWDFTNICRGPGISFFPGRRVQLPTLKVIGERARKLQIMVWGRI